MYASMPTTEALSNVTDAQLEAHVRQRAVIPPSAR